VGRFLCIVALLTTPLSAVGQVNDPAFADYFLVGRFGEICTMCEVVVLCRSGDDLAIETIPETGDFSLYHVQTRTFWSQVSTIWEWFISNFNSKSLAAGHTRPVAVYEITDGRWSTAGTVDARVSLEPARIVIGAQSIDRVDRRWLSGADEQPIGYCHRLPLWESLEIVEQRAPREPGS